MDIRTIKLQVTSFLREWKPHIAIVLILLVGSFFILARAIPVGEVLYEDAIVVNYAGRPGSAEVVKYLIMELSSGTQVRVLQRGRPRVGEKITLSVRDRIWFFSPVYIVHDTGESLLAE